MQAQRAVQLADQIGSRRQRRRLQLLGGL
jgi:hypothetical protein